MSRKGISLLVLLGVVLIFAGCTPAATPTATPTKAPAAAPTKAAEATKPAAAATTAPAAPTATSKQATVKFGTIQTMTDAGVYVAMDKGYFKEQGIDLELVTFRTTAELIAPLGTGQIDSASTTLSATLLSAADRGIDLKIVADKGQSRPNWEFTWVLLRKDLADSGKIKSASDLKGTKVSITSQGSTADQSTQLMIEQAGLKPDDVEVVVVPTADATAALGNKAVFAAYNMEPQIAVAVQQGFAVKWLPVSSFYGGTVQQATVVFGPAMLKDQDLSRRWMIAYLKGVRDYVKAFTTKEGRSDVVNSLVKYSPVKDPKLYDVIEMGYLDPNGMPDMKSVDAEYKWFVAKGLYTGKKTVNDITDLSFAEYAVQKLGKQ